MIMSFLIIVYQFSDIFYSDNWKTKPKNFKGFTLCLALTSISLGSGHDGYN